MVEWDEETKDWLARPCKCKGQKSIQRMFKQSGLTDEQRKIKLTDYRPTFDTMQMYNEVKDYIATMLQLFDEKTPAKGMALMGSVGIGKTMLATAIANEFLAHKIPVIFAVMPDLVAELRAAQFGPENELEDMIGKLASAPVVIFDDVAKEKSSDWVRTQYFRIIDARYRKCLTTIFTCNWSFDKISEELGDAVSSRFFALTRGRQFYVQSQDYRVFGDPEPMIPEPR